MIQAIINGIFKIIMKLVAALLSPIDSIVMQFLPSTQSIFSFINSAFSLVGQFFSWIIDAALIDSEVVAFIVAVITFKLTVPLVIYAIKIIVKWYNALKV